jgi:hypothetical protein
MKWTAVACAFVASIAAAQVPSLDDVMKGVRGLPRSGAGAADDRTSAAGIKEALAVGTERAVSSLAKVDGYFGNEAVKILLPSSLRSLENFARIAGYQKQVDEFVLSMNRAAESAVPHASRAFGDAIRDMTLEDARAIVTGGHTAATDYFRRKTSDRLHAAFKPIVARKVDEVGATRAYKNMIGRMPIAVGTQSLDLDEYVTDKALDGLFYMVGEEEKKIRTNPAARTTELLKKVFGR